MARRRRWKDLVMRLLPGIVSIQVNIRSACLVSGRRARPESDNDISKQLERLDRRRAEMFRVGMCDNASEASARIGPYRSWSFSYNDRHEAKIQYGDDFGMSQSLASVIEPCTVRMLEYLIAIRGKRGHCLETARMSLGW